MSFRSETEMSETVQRCVLDCLHHADPVQCIYEFAHRLVKAHGWTQADADEVADSAIKVLQTVSPHMGAK